MKATYAQLADHFHLGPWDIERLTDRQIIELYFHPRTEKGEIQAVPDSVAPSATTAAKTPTLNSECLAIDALVWSNIITSENGAAAKDKIRVKYRAAPPTP